MRNVVRIAIIALFLSACEYAPSLYPEQFKKVEALCAEHEGVKKIYKDFLTNRLYVQCNKNHVNLEVPKHIKNMRE